MMKSRMAWYNRSRGRASRTFVGAAPSETTRGVDAYYALSTRLRLRYGSLTPRRHWATFRATIRVRGVTVPVARDRKPVEVQSDGVGTARLVPRLGTLAGVAETVGYAFIASGRLIDNPERDGTHASYQSRS